MAFVNPYGGGAAPASSNFKNPYVDEADDGYSVTGFLGNVLGDVKDISGGVLGILKAGAGDLAKLVAEGATLGQTEFDPGPPGYDLATIGRQLPAAIKQDYATRYGSPTQFLQGLYEDPLSFVGDALIAGGAVAKGAQLGAKAGVISKVPKVLSPGTYPAMSLTGSTEELPALGFGLSANPVRRMMERGFYRGLSKPMPDLPNNIGESTALPAELANISERVYGYTGNARMAQNLRFSQLNKIDRYMRPTVSKHMESKAASKAFALLGLRFIHSRDIPLTILEDMKKRLGALEDPNIPESAADVVPGIQGTHIPDDAPPLDQNTGFLDNQHVNVNPLGPFPQATPGKNFGYLHTLKKRFPDRGETLQVFDQRLTTPYAPDGHVGARFTLITDNMDNAPDMLDDAAEALGGEVLGSLNNWGFQGPWRGYAGWVRVGDDVVEVNVATRKLADAQDVVSDIYSRQRRLLEQRGTAEEALIALEALDTPDPTAVRTQQQLIEELNEEELAAKAMADTFFDDSTMEYWANSRQIGRYGPYLSILGDLRTTTYKYITKPELDFGLDFRTIMDRAYGPVRLQEYHRFLAGVLKPKLAHLLATSKNNTEAYLPLSVELGKYFPEEIVQQILGPPEAPNLSWRPSARMAASNLINRVRWNTLADTITGEKNILPWLKWENFHKVYKNRQQPIPFYYPHISISKNPYSSYLLRGSRLEQMTEQGATPKARKLWMGHLMEEGRYIVDNPMDAYARTASEVARHQEFTRYIEEIKQKFGRRIANRKELALWNHGQNKGEVLWNPDGAKMVVDLRAQILAETHEHLVEGMTLDDAVAAALDNMLPKIVENALRSADGEVWAIPKHVADKVAQQSKWAFGWQVRMFWDGPINLWKSAVLSYSPRWIINNLLGNMVFTALRDPRAFKHILGQLTHKGREYMRYALGDEALFETEAGFFHKLTQRTTHFGGAEEAAPNLVGKVRATQEFAGFKPIRRLGEWTRAFNTHVEQAFRRGVMLSQLERQAMSQWGRGFFGSYKLLEKIAREGADPGMLRKAISEVDKTLGNYTMLSPVERNIIRRFIAPFYPFYRHVAKFVARMPLEHPLKTKVLQAIDNIDEEMTGAVPEWLQGAVQVGSLAGDALFLNLKNANPLETFTSAPTMGVTVLNPLLKIGLELNTGRSAYTGREFTSEDVFENFQGTKYQIIRDENGGVEDIEVLERPITPGLGREILMNFPQFGLLEDLMAEVIGPGSGAQYSQTGNVITEFGEPKYPQPPGLSFLQYSGVPLTPYDIDEYRLNQMLQEVQALRQGIRTVAMQ